MQHVGDTHFSRDVRGNTLAYYNVSFPQHEDVAQLLAAYDEVLPIIKDATENKYEKHLCKPSSCSLRYASIHEMYISRRCIDTIGIATL
jgi:hypothetical protein